MPDVKVQQEQALTRQEAARFIAALAEGLTGDGKVTVQLGSSTVELSVAAKVDWEFEVAVDGDEIELELKWSTSGRSSAEATDDESAEDQTEEDDSQDDESPQNGPVGAEADAPVDDEGKDGAVDEGDAGLDEAESVQKVASESAEPPGDPRGASPGVGRDAVNGVDSAAVRAWAAANGLTVSPRGRIKDEVLKAYRAAGS